MNHFRSKYCLLTPIRISDCGYPVDADKFALSEMLQWIWRSRIRKGEPIKIVILSKRMRALFTNWLYDKDTEE